MLSKQNFRTYVLSCAPEDDSDSSDSEEAWSDSDEDEDEDMDDEVKADYSDLFTQLSKTDVSDREELAHLLHLWCRRNIPKWQSQSDEKLLMACRHITPRRYKAGEVGMCLPLNEHNQHKFAYRCPVCA